MDYEREQLPPSPNSTQTTPTPEFRPGRALLNYELWSRDLKYLEDQQFHVEGWCWEAITSGSLNFEHPVCCWKTRRDIKFNNKRYQDVQFLIDEYRAKTEEQLNYEGTRKYKKQFEEKMDQYLENGRIRYATEEEEQFVVLNPLNCLEVKEGKFEIICHALLNSLYKKMKIDLVDVTREGEAISKIEKFQIEDLKSCYNQFSLSPNSIPWFGCRYKGRVLVWQVAFYGVAAAPALINKMNNIAVTAEALRTGVYGSMYLDDMLSELVSEISDQEHPIKKHMKEMGYIFSEKKSQIGTNVVFCGVELDAEKKTMRISEKTFFKLKEQVENNLLTKIDGTKTMSFDEFQTMMGIIARLARTSTSGYCNAHNLLARLAEAQNSQFKMVEFTKEDLVELNYWTSERREMPMKMFSVTAASFKLSDEVVVDEKDAKRRKLNEVKNSSDASKKAWGCHITGKDGRVRAHCGEIPDEYANDIIVIKEGYGFYKLVKYMDADTEASVALDSTNLDDCFKKRRSRNPKLNKILASIYQEMVEHNKKVSTFWIPTKRMNVEGSDKISRGIYSDYKDPFGLSEYGASYLVENFGKVNVDVYSSPSDNPLNIKYCSTINVEQDPLCLRRTAMEFLLSQDLVGRMLVFPPDDLVEETTKVFKNMNWKNKENKLQFLYIVRQKRAMSVRLALDKITYLQFEIFQRAGKKASKLKFKSSDTFVLFIIGHVWS